MHCCPICDKVLSIPYEDMWETCFHEVGQYNVYYFPEGKTSVAIRQSSIISSVRPLSVRNKFILGLNSLVFLTAEKIEKLLLLQ
jgi:hypothetical protein